MWLLITTLACTCTKVVFNHQQSIVLDEQMAYHKNILNPCSRTAPPTFQGTWTPTQEDIAKMEANFRRLQRLKATECCLRTRIESINTYFLQYVGIVVDGKKLIYINAIDKSDADKNSNNVPHDWCDGGPGCWGCLYDPATKKFFHLAINGIA